MNIGAMNTRIAIEKSAVVTDQYGNHTSTWTPYFSCWATVTTSARSAEEHEDAGHTVEGDHATFTVRYCTETACVTSKKYRIRLNGRIYDITHVDDMGFKRNSRKFEAVLKER